MKFSVPRNEIYKAIQKIFGVVPTKTTTPILYDILFELEGNNLKITATDLEILTSTVLVVSGMEDGIIAIPAKFINEIIRELGNVELLFETEEGYRIKLSTNQGEYKIVGDPGDDFPLMPVEEDMNKFEMSKKSVKRMVAKTIFAVSQDELRPALMGILFQIRSDELKLVGTDGRTLSRIIYTSFETNMEDSDLIVPTKALSLLDKNLESSDDSLQISFSKNYVIFDLDTMKIYSRLVDSDYPDYESVIPDNNNKTLTIDTSLLLGSIKRVSIFSSTLTHQIQFSIEPDKMEVFSQDIDVGGEGRETINVDFDGEPMNIGFNAQYFIDVLKHVPTNQVKIILDTAITAAMVLPFEQEENENLLMILMPVRLNDYYEESEGENIPNDEGTESSDGVDY
jgi:DNA polymerase III subunit beta